jgi:hypothetical protein
MVNILQQMIMVHFLWKDEKVMIAHAMVSFARDSSYFVQAKRIYAKF